MSLVYAYIIVVLLNHWVADFVTQSDYVACNKSKKIDILLEHAGIYTLVMLPACVLVLVNKSSNYSLSVPITVCVLFLTHAVQDYFTSRLTSRLFAAQRRHDFFVVIGLDQALHYLVLLLIYYVNNA